jgi:hypothetical protein
VPLFARPGKLFINFFPFLTGNSKTTRPLFLHADGRRFEGSPGIGGLSHVAACALSENPGCRIPADPQREETAKERTDHKKQCVSFCVPCVLSR